MKQQPFVDSMEEHLVRLIDSGIYFGSRGAIAYFKKHYLVCAIQDLKKGNHTLAMQYINVLYSAMSASVKGNFFQKARIPHLVYTANKWADKVRATRLNWYASRESGELQIVRVAQSDWFTKYESGELHILMSLAARSLQILKKIQLLTVAIKIRSKLLFDLENSFKAIKNKAAKESLINVHGKFLELGPRNRTLLMAESLLYELHVDGIYVLEDSPGVKHRIWMYSMHNERSKNRDTAQIVTRLFRSIGKLKEAEAVATRANNPDQMKKSMR